MTYKIKISTSLRLFFTNYVVLLLASFASVLAVNAQQQATGAQPEPDVLIFNDGEKLIGQLESSTGGSVKFKSNMAGEVTVDWSKIKELHSAQKFALVPKGAELGRGKDLSRVSRGTVSMTNQKIEINTGAAAPQTVPVPDAGYLINENAFLNAMQPHGFTSDWSGGASAGISLVEATQKSHSYTGALNLVRTEPTVDWLDPRSRTIVDFNVSYGSVSQPLLPTVKTEIVHGGLERDQYLNRRLFAFAQAAWDHNYSQGLDLGQQYGAGLGWTAIKSAIQELDLKASMAYIHQAFTDNTSKSLVGTNFAELYNRKFFHGILFNQELSVTPAWNDTSAWTATGLAGLTFPVYKRIGFSVNVLDTYLNDPPPNFKKNSFQFTTGISYAIGH